MIPLAQCRLYTFVDTAYLHGRAPDELARQLCDGGSDIIQLRAKDKSPAEVLRLAGKIHPITEAAGIGLVINDFPTIATQTGAAICHLGQEDFFEAGHTRISEIPGQKDGLKIGLSSHAPDQAQRAIDAGADYIAIGPIYATGTKPTARPVTLEYVKWAAQNVQIPWFAIGGINFETLDLVLAAGAQRICVVSAILNAPKPAEACQKFKDRILSAAPFKP
ncbi:MAG: thiamine-phosphate pyrophosphorylase [Verrucomicrobiales bacterium]|nr:thiamine-phosphate pyrophosphorylase [Verrucomicrobiales bacterium]